MIFFNNVWEFLLWNFPLISNSTSLSLTFVPRQWGSQYRFCKCVVKFKGINVKVTQLCLILCDPIDCTVHRILQARIPERVAVPFSRGSSQPRDRTQVSHTGGRLFTSWATREAQIVLIVDWSTQAVVTGSTLSNGGSFIYFSLVHLLIFICPSRPTLQILTDSILCPKRQSYAHSCLAIWPSITSNGTSSRSHGRRSVWLGNFSLPDYGLASNYIRPMNSIALLR